MKLARWHLWSRWINANAFAELIGLGITFALGFWIFGVVRNIQGIIGVLSLLFMMLFAGLFEGLVVGLAQWRAMRFGFPRVRGRAWVTATIVGALAAWALGMLPSTMMSVFITPQTISIAEPPGLMMLPFASIMGLLLGSILALPQWRVLRRTVSQAWIWVPANGLAWALCMPVLMTGIDWACAEVDLGRAVGGMALSLLAVGTLAGLIHGLALVKLMPLPDQTQ